MMSTPEPFAIPESQGILIAAIIAVVVLIEVVAVVIFSLEKIADQIVKRGRKLGDQNIRLLYKLLKKSFIFKKKKN